MRRSERAYRISLGKGLKGKRWLLPAGGTTARFAERRCGPALRELMSLGFASKLVGRKRCPRCGADLWVVGFTDGALFFIRQRDESLHAFLTSLAALISPDVRLSRAEIEAALGSGDSLDLVEFVMEVEEALQSQEREPGSGG